MSCDQSVILPTFFFLRFAQNVAAESYCVTVTCNIYYGFYIPLSYCILQTKYISVCILEPLLSNWTGHEICKALGIKFGLFQGWPHWRSFIDYGSYWIELHQSDHYYASWSFSHQTLVGKQRIVAKVQRLQNWNDNYEARKVIMAILYYCSIKYK